MKKFFLAFSFCVAALFGEQPTQPPAALYALKQRQPNWRVDFVEMYPQGSPRVAIFYEPTPEGKEVAVKQVSFF